MASRGETRLGVTDPISEALPTEDENRKTDSLKEELRRQNNYESASDTNKRYVQRDFQYTPAEESSPLKPQLFLSISNTFTYTSMLSETSSLIPYSRSRRSL